MDIFDTLIGLALMIAGIIIILIQDRIGNSKIGGKITVGSSKLWYAAIMLLLSGLYVVINSFS